MFTALTSLGQALQDASVILKSNEVVHVKVYKNHKPINLLLINKIDFIRVVHNDSIRYFYPKDILGFRIGKNSYKSLLIKNGNEAINIFCEVLEEGKASVYYYGGNILGQKEIYIYNRRDEPQYYISLEEKLNAGGQSSDASAPPMPTDMNMVSQLNKVIQNVADAHLFKAQFIRYFSDCPEVMNKLKLDWYIPSSISSLFEDYNSSCGK